MSALSAPRVAGTWQWKVPSLTISDQAEVAAKDPVGFLLPLRSSQPLEACNLMGARARLGAGCRDHSNFLWLSST